MRRDVIQVAGSTVLTWRGIFQRSHESVRRDVAIEPQDGLPGFVEKQDGGRELHLEAGGKLLLGHGAVVEPLDLAVAPHVDGDHVKVFPQSGFDVLLRKIAFDQGVAVGAAVLREQEHHALVLGFRFGDIVLQVEEACLEPARVFGLDRAMERALFLVRCAGEAGKQEQDVCEPLEGMRPVHRM